LSEAIADFDNVIRLKPSLPDGYYYRGEACANLGDDERAKSDFGTATRLNPRLRSQYS
jgi:tetratricopeptide (TPR) repeat protein